MSEEGVKSAKRVFMILEVFARLQKELSVAEIAQACQFPSSSTSALMRQMAELGYLHYDGGRRTYRPTPRLPLLTDWINNSLFHKDAVLELMQDISDATGETVMLGAENGRHVRYIHDIEGTAPLRLASASGQSRDYANTAIGLALLSTWPRRKVVGYLHRFNAEHEPQRQIDVNVLLQKLEKIRSDGYALSIGGRVSSGGALAMLLPRAENQQLLAIGIGGAIQNITENAERWIGIMRQHIDRSFSNVRTCDGEPD